MFRSTRGPSSSFRDLLALLAVAGTMILIAGGTAVAQRRTAAHAAPEEVRPPFHDYRGIQLGMTADEVRSKLGEPKDKGTEQDFYLFGETETAQVVYDKAQKVITISADFLAPTTGALTPKDVFGEDIKAKPDGSIYRMERYPKAGFWLSYNRTGGASPLTTVTVQKIQ